MDDSVKRAEELLQERMSTRTNGHVVADDAPEGPRQDEGGDERSRSDTEAALTRDLQRLAADFSNYRKRNEAERAEFAKYAKADLIRRLLDVLDGYDRALETMPADAQGQPWLEGMWLIERKLRGVLEAEGLQPLEAAGRPFDPYQHEAVAHVASGLPEGTVVAEYQKGYRLHDRIIRPALVTVSNGQADTAQESRPVSGEGGLRPTEPQGTPRAGGDAVEPGAGIKQEPQGTPRAGGDAVEPGAGIRQEPGAAIEKE